MCSFHRFQLRCVLLAAASTVLSTGCSDNAESKIRDLINKRQAMSAESREQELDVTTISDSGNDSAEKPIDAEVIAAAEDVPSPAEPLLPQKYKPKLSENNGAGVQANPYLP